MSEIRPATLADAREIALMYRPYVLNTAVSFEEEPPNATEIGTRIERAGDLYPWLVASEAGRLAGYAYASPHHPRAAYRWSVDVSVYLQAKQQGRGIGRRLMTALLEELTARGFAAAFAGIALPNPASIALFESLGFSSVGVFRRCGFKLGTWQDVGWWQLALSDDPAPSRAPGSR